MTDQALVQQLIRKARAAQDSFEGYNQQEVDEVVAAVAWAGYKEENARRLAHLAYEHTRLGNAQDKLIKVRRKVLGTMQDLKGAKSVGVIDVDDEKGLTTIAKPMGVIAAIQPATHPAATPINNIMIMLKGRNAVILAPHPKGEAACAEVVRLARQQLAKLNAPLDLVHDSGLERRKQGYW